MLTTPEKFVFVVLILATAAAFFTPIVRRVRIVLAGAPEDRFGDLVKRFGHAAASSTKKRFLSLETLVISSSVHV